MNLNEVEELEGVADDYERAGVQSVEQLADMMTLEVVDLGINGIGPSRAKKHIAAAREALGNGDTVENEITPEDAEKESSAPVAVAPVKKQASIEGHPALTYLDAKLADKVVRYAQFCGRVHDPVAWLDSLLVRARTSRQPDHFMARFARNLELRLV